MEELTALLESKEGGNDLIDKLIGLLDRQTDHKISPNVLLGILGLFNVLTIMSVVREAPHSGIRQVTGPGGSNGNPQAQDLNDTLSSLMNSQGGGQPDLMSLLGNLATKKKINPGLLLSLFSMLNQGGAGSSQNTQQGNQSAQAQAANPVPAQARYSGQSQEGQQSSAPAAEASDSPGQQKETLKNGNYQSTESNPGAEKKSPDDKHNSRHGFEGKRGIGQRS